MDLIVLVLGFDRDPRFLEVRLSKNPRPCIRDEYKPCLSSIECIR